MAEGYQAAFQADVDPISGPVTIGLSPNPALPDDPRRVVQRSHRGRRRDARPRRLRRARRIQRGGGITDLGDIELEPGIVLSGRVVLADGKPVPPHTHIMINRLRACDISEQEPAPDGSFRFEALPRETVEVSIRLAGCELSTQNESLLRDHGDSRQSLAGRLEQDTRLRIVLEPVGGRKRAEPPRSPEDWSAFNAQQDIVRSEPLRGAPLVP